MLTAEIKVDGNTIAHIYAVKDGDTVGELRDYVFEYYRPERGVIKGKVRHHRPNGAVALLKEICENVEMQGGK